MINSEKIWILGPCSMETEDLYFQVGEELIPLMKNKSWYYNASFDKANRSSVDGKRGPSLDESLRIFNSFKKNHPEVKLTTDVHEVHQVKKLAGIIDCIQIPAFLCRQTDLITECAKYFPVVNIKKGQWMSPQNMCKGLDKIKNINSECKAWVTERGTQFGYGQLIVDFGAVEVLNKAYDKVILDCTHSTQKLKPNGRTGGSGDMAIKYFKVADEFDYDGVFAETHPNPPEAYSDGDCQIPLEIMKRLLENK